MAGFDTLVVAMSCAEADAKLVDYANLVALLGGTREAFFVHVVSPHKHSTPIATLRQQLRDRVAAQFRAPARVECDVLQGPLTDRLVEYVDELEADLVLVGGKRRVLGARLAMVAPCSVAVIPAEAPATISHLAVAVDFSDSAADMLEWVTSLAAADRSIRCTALHVMTHESVDLFSDNESEPEQAEAMRQILARADRSGVPVEPRLASVSTSSDIGRHHRFILPASIGGADVAHAILAEVKAIGADCLALSTRGRSASASILLGSVTEKVIERSPIPLLVSKHSGARMGFVEVLLGRTGRRQAALKTN